MLYVDVGNTLRGGLRTGIRRVVRSLSYELAVNSPTTTRLIAFDVTANRYFALADPSMIRSADSLADIGREARTYFDLDAMVRRDIFFEPDSSWTKPLNRGALLRTLEAKGIIVVVLNHDAIPILLPEVCHPNTLVPFAETIADHIQYADYALATSARVASDLGELAERFLGRSITTRVIKLGADFAAGARLDLALQSARTNLGFIDRIAVLTKPAAIAAAVGRYFPRSNILTDDEVAGDKLPADHQARNTWLRKMLYAQDAIEPNFLAGDEDSLALRPLDRAYYQTGGRHAAYSFQEDMGTWLAGSPGLTSFDRGARNTWRLLAEAAYPVRAYASHVPQIINKGLVNEIFDRFVIRPDGPAYDEWSLYFDVASQLYPRHFATKPYGMLGWPRRPDKPGLYVIRFYAALDSGARLEARGRLTVVAGEGGS